jgi:hypothetical protein
VNEIPKMIVAFGGGLGLLSIYNHEELHIEYFWHRLDCKYIILPCQPVSEFGPRVLLGPSHAAPMNFLEVGL